MQKINRQRLRWPVRKSLAFTLTEILIVIMIIVLVMALAVPAFNYITGSKSISSAENLVSAMLGRARAYAMTNERPAGIAFFINPRDGRSTMALVIQKATANDVGEDKYANYKGWVAKSWQEDPTNPAGKQINKETPYKVGQEIIAMVEDGPNNTAIQPPLIPDFENRLVVRRYICSQDHVADPTDPNKVPPPNNTTTNPPGSPAQTDSPSNAYWGSQKDQFLDVTTDGEFQALPAGVGLQVINDPKGANRDRYLRTGMIMFDSEGRMTSNAFAIRKDTTLGQLLWVGKTAPDQVPAVGAADVYTGLGVVLYDQSSFINQAGHTEGDFILSNLPAYPYANGSYAGTPGVISEQAEEAWLDTNAMQLFVNRYNGTLLRSE